MGFIDANLNGFQSEVFCGPVPQVGVLKDEVLNMESKPFTLQGETQTSSQLYGSVSRVGFTGRVCVPAFLTCFNMDIFSFI